MTQWIPVAHSRLETGKSVLGPSPPGDASVPREEGTSSLMVQIYLKRKLGPGRNLIDWSNLCSFHGPSWVPPQSPARTRLPCRGLLPGLGHGCPPRSPPRLHRKLFQGQLAPTGSLTELSPSLFLQNRSGKRTRALHRPRPLPFSLSSQGASLGNWSERLRKSPRKRDGGRRQSSPLRNER